DAARLHARAVQGAEPQLPQAVGRHGGQEGGQHPAQQGHTALQVAVRCFEGADAVLKGGGSGGRRAPGRRLLSRVGPAYRARGRHHFLQSTLNVAFSETIWLGATTRRVCQPSYFPPNCQDVLTSFVPAFSKVTLKVGPLAPSLRGNVYSTVPAPLAVI